ncbi:MAG: hypothetical protein HY395_02910 [Candidatus Doudnabacteria bacterium]|nr:hypothetical protein [Candidatus Doudnabacteria bacterium]
MPIIKLATPLKYSHPKGTPVTVVDRYIDPNTKKETWFTAPKIVGVYYKKSIEFFNKALELRTRVFASRGPVNPKDSEQGTAFMDEQAVFDFFTEACSGIILLFGAVESLVNELIEKAPAIPYTEEKRAKIISLGKLSVYWRRQKSLSSQELSYKEIDLKLKYILPSLYSFESPAQKSFWGDFKLLKRLRDSVTHPTKSRAYGASKNMNSIYAEFFGVDFQQLVNGTGDLIKYLQISAISS